MTGTPDTSETTTPGSDSEPTDSAQGEPSVGVLIINWNQAELAVRAARSALGSHGVRVHVVILDNGSIPGSLDLIVSDLGLELRPARGKVSDLKTLVDNERRITIIKNGANLGFTGANNVGMAHAFDDMGVDYCFLLNCDAYLDPSCLRKLVDAAANHESAIGLVGAMILDGRDPNRISFARSRISRWGWPVSLDHDRARSLVALQGITIEQLVGGAAMLIPRGTYRRVGGQDDRFFFDVDDTEYSLRAAGPGHDNLMVWNAIAYHDMGSSVAGRSNLSRYYNLRNLLLLRKTHYSGLTRRLFLARYAQRVFRDIAVAILRRDLPRLRTVYSALRDHVLGRYGIGPQYLYEKHDPA